MTSAPLPEAFDAVGCEFAVTRTVRDWAALLDVMAGPMPGDPHPLLLPGEGFAATIDHPRPTPCRGDDPTSRGDLETHPAVEAAIEATTAALESLGHTIVDEPPRLPRFDRMLARLIDQWAVGTAFLVNNIERADRPRDHPSRSSSPPTPAHWRRTGGAR